MSTNPEFSDIEDDLRPSSRGSTRSINRKAEKDGTVVSFDFLDKAPSKSMVENGFLNEFYA